MASSDDAEFENAMSIMKLLTSTSTQNRGGHMYNRRQYHHHHHHHQQQQQQQHSQQPLHNRQFQHQQQQQAMGLQADHSRHSSHSQSHSRQSSVTSPSRGLGSPNDSTDSTTSRVERGNGGGGRGGGGGGSDGSSSSNIGNNRSDRSRGPQQKNGGGKNRPSSTCACLPLEDEHFYSQEPSDCKSPKQEGRMVSPNSCMQALPLGGSGGEGSTGSAHLQAATSTTPESGSGTLPQNFLVGVHGASLGASPSPHMKQEVIGAVPGSSIQAKLCQVCNDNASGFHYGVWSCEGCKAFFKRSIQGPVDYICPATNTCTIDKHRRKSCQACRLRRCYEVGMNKGSQRKERKSSTNSGALRGKRYRADSSDSTVNSTNNGASSSKSAKRSRSASILEALQKADLPVIESHHNHSLPASRVHLLNTLIQLANSELVYLINWAKHVPGYTLLTLSDQVHLIECCWMELLLLNCAFRSMEHEGRTLVFAPDFHLDRQQWAVTGMEDVLEQVSAVSEQMVLYSLNKEELLLLQATVLVNAEVRRLDSFAKIQEMRQVILDVFLEVAGRHQGFGNWRHAPSILLLLTHIRQAGERGITYFQRLKMEGCVTFNDLLTEMLDAHNSSGEGRQLQHQQHHHHPQQPQQQQPPPPPPHQQQQQQHPSQHPARHPHPQHPQQPSMPE